MFKKNYLSNRVIKEISIVLLRELRGLLGIGILPGTGVLLGGILPI